MTEGILSSPRDIPPFVREQVNVLAEGYQAQAHGEALGLLACAVAYVDGREAGRDFAAAQLPKINQQNADAFARADIWLPLGKIGDDQARTNTWRSLVGMLNSIAEGNNIGLSEGLAARMYDLVKTGASSSQFQQAREAAEYAATHSDTPRYLALLYEAGDELSLDTALSLFGAANHIIAHSNNPSANSRQLHAVYDQTLCDLGCAAARKRESLVAADILRHLDTSEDADVKTIIRTAMLATDPDNEVLRRDVDSSLRRMRGISKVTPVLMCALVENGFEPAIEETKRRLDHPSDDDRMWYEKYLLALTKTGDADGRARLLGHINNPNGSVALLETQLSNLVEHGLKQEALEIGRGIYDSKPLPRLAYWLWVQEQSPALELWQGARAGAETKRPHDAAAPARALCKLASLATRRASGA